MIRKKLLLLLLALGPSLWAEAQDLGGFKDFKASGNFTDSHQINKEANVPTRAQAVKMAKRGLQAKLQLVNRIPSAKLSADSAEIVLEANDVYGFGNIGYQMLLDKNHNTYGSSFSRDNYSYTGTYDDFEYKIPSDAEASGTTSSVVIDGEGKVQIPAGTYDYMITSPRQEDGVVIVRTDWGCQNDFTFKGGYSYRFLITYDSENLQEVATPYADIDAQVSSVTLPANIMDLTSSEYVTVQIANRGTSAITNVPLSYSVNDSSPVTETYNGEIAAGSSASFTFATKADFSAVPGTFKVKAWTSLPGDLIVGNDTATATTRHIAPASLPFVENFPSANDFEGSWQSVSNNSNAKWGYNSWGSYPSDDGTGSVWCSTYTACDSWLISPPLSLSSGDNHIKFFTHSVEGTTENISLFLGQEADTAEMSQIAQTTVSSGEWQLRVFNFNVAKPGVYYIAFRTQSDGSGFSVNIDSVLVDKGAYELQPSLHVVKVLLPYSNCDLSDATPIGIRLSNTGTGPASHFIISYKINDGQAIEQTITDTLPTETTRDYYFERTADFSEMETFTVTVKVSVGKESSEETGIVKHYAPITELPFTTDFYNNEGINDMWIPMGDNSWEYESMGSCYSSLKKGVENGLLSRCITFSTPFRVKVAYGGPQWYNTAFYIAYGRPGTDPASWKKVFSDSLITETREKEFLVNPDGEGEYDLLIVDTSTDDNASLKLYQLTVSAVYDYDQRITSVNSQLAPYTPLEQALAKGTYKVNVENRGTKQLTNVKATINASNGHGTFTTATQPTLAAGDTATLSGEGALKNLKVGDTLSVKVVASASEKDGYNSDNSWALGGDQGINVTDTVYAFENVSEFVNGTGMSGAPISFGQIYHLATADTLTSVTFGLAQDNYYTTSQIGVAVYEVASDGVTLSRQLFSTQLERKAEGGLRTVTFPARLLQPGNYFIEIQQLGTNNIGMSYQQASEAVCYQDVDGVLQAVSGAYLVIRANFGHGAKAYKHNVTVTDITRPTKTAALFSSDETVSAVVENQGSVEESSITVLANVAGQTKSTIVSLLPYERDTVVFAGFDLSVPGNYVLTVTANVNGDENMDDNSDSLNITSREEASPYTLDFESCNDFDTGHEFNPRWWTENRSGYGTDGFWAYSYPHNGEKVGFLAFNVDAMTKIYDDAPAVEGFYAHSGARFGVAFGLGYPAPDDAHADTWLVSPKLRLSTNSSLELYVKTHALETSQQKLEKYRILISDTNDDFDSFTVIGGDREAPVDWTKVTVDLSAYDNKDVYVALKYCTKYLDNYIMMLDDISVKTDNMTGIGGIQSSGDIAIRSYGGVLHVLSNNGMPIRSIDVFDASGMRIYHKSNISETSLSITTSQWGKGVYVARVNVGGKSQTLKYVIAK